MDEGWDVVEQRVKNLGLHIEVGTKNWLTIILDHAEQIKSERDEAEAKLDDKEAECRSLRGQVNTAEAKLAKAEEDRDEALNQLDSANHSLEVLGKQVRTILDGRTEAEAKLAKAVEVAEIIRR